MKWYNKEKTKCLDLDKISYWEYVSPEETESIKQDSDELGFGQVTELIVPYNQQLKVHVGSVILNFDNEEAEEIYDLLVGNVKKGVI